MKGRPIRVLVAGNYRMYRGLLAGYIGQHADHAAFESASRMDGLGAEARESRPDVIVLDCVLTGGGDGLADESFLSPFPFPMVLVCASCAEEEQWNGRRPDPKRVAVSACREPESLPRAIRSLHRGEREILPRADHFDCPPEMFRRTRGLTKTELVVFSMIAGGLPNRAVAQRLGVSHRTVENHRLKLRKKLGIRDREGLIREAVRVGLVR